MKHKVLFRVCLLLLIICSTSFADLIAGAYYSPGIKIGYQFGRFGGFTIGFENSIVGAFFYGMPYAGIVGGVGVNVNQKEFIGYWEIESGFTPLGIALGGEWYKGYHGSIRVFGGTLAFISYKHLFRTHINEFSLIGKVPLPVYEVMDHGTYLFGREQN